MIHFINLETLADMSTVLQKRMNFVTFGIFDKYFKSLINFREFY